MLKKNKKKTFIFSLLLLITVILCTILHWRWEVLKAYQDTTTFKIITGGFMGALVVSQFGLYFARKGRSNKILKVLYQWHQRVGLILPIIFYFHANSFGHGYVAIFTGLFFGNIMIGLLHIEYIVFRHPLYTKLWLFFHIVFAITLLILIPYHVAIVAYYK